MVNSNKHVNMNAIPQETNSLVNLRCVQQLFSEQAKENPDKIAVKFDDNQLSYFELNDKATQLASLLCATEQGLNPIIGIAIDRSIDLIIAVLGIIKSGGACLPLDTNYPENRLDYIITDSGVNIIITNNKTIKNYPYLEKLKTSKTIIYLDEIDFDGAHFAINVKESVDLNDLIYVLYTSGSTGNPKGVEMPHRALANLIAWHLTIDDFKNNLRTLQFSPISFDVSFQEIFATLCAGQTLVLVTDEIRKNPYLLYDIIKREKISRLFLPAIALQQFAEIAKKQEPLKFLKAIITAGEQLKITPDIEAFFAKHTKTVLYNHYGPTETHVVTSYKLSDRNEKWPSLPPIGFPIPNVQIYVLDKDNRQVKINEEGELCVGGLCLARGYHNKPDLTNERFTANLFTEGLIYRTGDLATFQEDGAIKYLGRIDQQVKIRGFRVELGEIEVTLSKHKNLKECVVLAKEFSSDYKILIAYIILNSDSAKEFNISEQSNIEYKVASKALFLEFQNWLSNLLPDYMLPSTYIIVHQFPLTPSGKVDRLLLPLPPLLNVNLLLETLRKSQKTLEEKIIFVWEELLQIKPIKKNENFFDLGGNSLLLLTLHKILCELVEKQFPIIILFKNTTIHSLVAYFSKNENEVLNNQSKTSSRNSNTRTTNIRKNIRQTAQTRI